MYLERQLFGSLPFAISPHMSVETPISGVDPKRSFAIGRFPAVHLNISTGGLVALHVQDCPCRKKSPVDSSKAPYCDESNVNRRKPCSGLAPLDCSLDRLRSLSSIFVRAITTGLGVR